MPKGAKIKGGYATISDDPDAMNLRTISEIMTADGDKMNHASVRNHLIRAMKKFVNVLDDHYGIVRSAHEVDELARNPAFQESVMALVQNEYALRDDADDRC